MSCSGLYAADCQQSLQRLFLDLPGAGASPWIERDVTGPWRFHWTDTQRAWLDEFEGMQGPCTRVFQWLGCVQGQIAGTGVLVQWVVASVMGKSSRITWG
jgi:hypothetical protein